MPNGVREDDGFTPIDTMTSGAADTFNAAEARACGKIRQVALTLARGRAQQ